MLNFKTNNNTILGIWLFILTLMVYLIILIGGLTRLTESGLSMVDWRPLLGIIPPLNEKDWIEFLIKLIDDSNLRSRIGKEAINTVDNDYTVDVLSQKYLNVLNNI